jgi:hypothetical protein
MNQQIEMLERAGKLLSALDEHLVFVGGATISLYLDDASVEDVPPFHYARNDKLYFYRLGMLPSCNTIPVKFKVFSKRMNWNG